MWLVLVKLAIGICAFAVAVTAALDMPLRKRLRGGASPNLWNRLTVAGKVNLACAVATLALVLVNEVAEYYDSIAKEEIAKADQDRLQIQLASTQQRLVESRLALGRTIIELETLSRKNGYMILSLDNTMIRQEISRVSLKNASGVGTKLSTPSGQSIVPKDGDEVRWNLVCQRSLPPIDEASQTCAEIAYGRLMANGESVVLRTAVGSQILFGTRANGGELEYRSPSEDFTCNGLTEQMRGAMCELHLSIWREGRWQFRDKDMLSAPVTTKVSAEDACRRYEALYGESCEDALKRLK